VTQFWIIAALLCAAALAILLFPLWRVRRRQGHWSTLGLVVAIAVVPVAVGLYTHVSNWNPAVEARLHEGARLVSELAARLEQRPDDLQGWRLLANSYMALGRYDDGRDAYAQLWKRTSQPDDELKLAYAEAQILTDRGTLTGEAGKLVEEVLAAEPENPKALWYGGLVALELGRQDLVRARWTSLLAMNPPEQVADVVRQQLGQVGGAAPRMSAPPTAQASSAPVDQLGPNAQLFVLAQAPEGGPPLAVIRASPQAVPGKFTLSEANSMIQGRSIANYPEVTVVARLSASGQPLAQPGDWFAQAVVRPADGNPVALVIDQVVQ
jgi:cytochrome c-type biogenesis protein CcmH